MFKQLTVAVSGTSQKKDSMINKVLKRIYTKIKLKKKKSKSIQFIKRHILSRLHVIINTVVSKTGDFAFGNDLGSRKEH